MPEIMRLWLKNVPEFAVFFAQCQLVIILCEQLVSGLNTSITATGNIRNSIIAKSIVRVAYLPIIYLMFSVGFGPISSYIVLFIIHGIINQMLLSTYYAYKLADFDWKHYSQKVFAPALTVFLLVLVTGHYLSLLLDGIIQIFVIFAESIFVYTILYFFVVFDIVEKQIIKGIILKIKSLI